MIFIFEWLIVYAMIMCAMCLDNVFWIPDSPEWPSMKKSFYIIILFGREYGFPKDAPSRDYVWRKRILEVLKHPRDIIPGIISSLLLTIFINIIF